MDSMPYGRPIIKSISQNYQEAEVTLLFLNLHLTFHFHFLNLHNLLLNLLIQERDVLLSCEVEALGENLVIWKQGDRTISAGSIMVGSVGLGLGLNTAYDKKSDEGSNSVRMRPENSGASKVVQK